MSVRARRRFVTASALDGALPRPDNAGHTIPRSANWVVMRKPDPSDEHLLPRSDAASFEVFYCRHVRALLGYFMRRTRDPELAADLCAETFAAALAGRHRFRAERGPATAWLYGIAAKKLADAQRRGHADLRMRRRLGMERIELSDAEFARIDGLGEPDRARLLMDRLAPEQRDAVAAHVLEGRPYGQLARDLETSEAVVRKRVSRGLAAMRHWMGVGR
jgi:RNA polymerase sigma factor (sigma-70 family)